MFQTVNYFVSLPSTPQKLAFSFRCTFYKSLSLACKHWMTVWYLTQLAHQQAQNHTIDYYLFQNIVDPNLDRSAISPIEIYIQNVNKIASLVVYCRRHKFRWYPDCFRGYEAVTWLLENSAVSCREEAEALGADMLGRGLIFHVTHRHGFEDDRNRLYR